MSSGLPVLYGRNVEVNPPGEGISVDGLLIKEGHAGTVRSNFGSQSFTSSTTPVLLNKDSPQDVYVTGSVNQLILMPPSTTLTTGMSFRIHNRSTATVTIRANRSTDCTVTTGVILPVATLDVTSTAGYSASGTIYVETDGDVETLTYTGVTATSFTGVSGGTGTVSIGAQVGQNGAVLTNIPELPRNGFSQHICSNPGASTWNTFLYEAPVLDSAAGVVWNDTLDEGVFYGLNTRENSFDSTCVTIGQNAATGGSNQVAMGTEASTKGATATIDVLSDGDALPQVTINVDSTTGFIRGGDTTVAAASNAMVLPQATINVASTFYFPNSGNIYVTTDLGRQLVAYTGKTGTTFTGCTGGAGIMSTGGLVHLDTRIEVATADAGIQVVNYVSLSPTTFNGCFGGTGTLATGGQIFQSTASTSHIALGHRATVTGSAPRFDRHGVAIGRDAKAYGDDVGGSVAFGVQADAQRQAATAVGTNSFAGEYCVAVGCGNTGPGTGANATGFSTAVGFQATAIDRSVSVGVSSFSSTQSVALGYEAMAVMRSVAEGFRASAMNQSVAIGANSLADDQSVGLGAFTRAVINRSLCIGSKTTEISALSNGVTLPAHTIHVDSTTAFSDSGTLLVTNSAGVTQTVTYTGPNTATAFVGCSGGTGTLVTDALVAQYTEALDAEHAFALSIHSNTVGTYWLRMNGKQLEAYPGLLATASLSTEPIMFHEKSLPRYHIFSGVGSTEQLVLLPPSGFVSSGHQIAFLNDSTAKVTLSTSVGAYVSVPIGSLPQSTILASDTSAFTGSGTIYISGDSGVQEVAYTGTTNNATNIDVASDGMALPQATITVVSTVGFAASGSVLVTTNAGVYEVAYIGTTATTFTGCTGGSGTLSTGGSVTQISFTGCTGGSGSVTVDELTGTGRIYQVQNTVGCVWPNTQMDVVCAANSGAFAIDGWTMDEADATVDSTISALPNPTNYAASEQGVAVDSLYRTAQNGSTGLLGTTITAGSDGLSLPQSTINVASSAGFSQSGSVFVTTGAGQELVSYTGTTSTTLEGCAGGSGLMSTGGAVTQNGTIPITSSLSGTALTVTTASDPIIAPGMFLAGGGVLAGTQILTGSGGAGAYTVDVAQTTSTATTIAAASDTLSLPQSTINVASTAGFFPAGSILLTTSLGSQLVTYTGPNTATTFEGCSGGAGVMSTGGAVTQIIAPTEVVYSLADPDEVFVRTA